ncbi:nucleoside recognition domain-containing protein [Ihubacter sp. rT4E-8]|uniref:nucleoside recognition domain-containing protein n=1 Tax=unclassified Ihubacter TaxID=2633299 RepID=UPI001379D381
MMNYIWVALAVIAVIAGGATGTMDKVLENIFSFAETAVMDIALPLTGIMAFFCGVMKVMEKAGLCEKLGKGIAPVMRLLFPDVPADHPANSAMALYFAANILGIGNAATPFGLKAMQELQTLNPTKGIATNAQCMLMAISTTSITLIPVTAIGLRSTVQTTGAAEIIAPVIIATTISTITGVAFTLLFQKVKKWKWENVIEKEMAAGRLEINEDYIGDSPIVLPEGYNSVNVKEEKVSW